MVSDSSGKPGDHPEYIPESFPDRPEYSRRPMRWSPPMDIYETGTHVVAVAELPGLKQEDIRVCFNKGILMIAGSKKKATAAKGSSYFCVERHYGAFKRTFRVLHEIDVENMDATYDAGILTILMPKKCLKEGGRTNG